MNILNDCIYFKKLLVNTFLKYNSLYKVNDFNQTIELTLNSKKSILEVKENMILLNNEELDHDLIRDFSYQDCKILKSKLLDLKYLYQVFISENYGLMLY